VIGWVKLQLADGNDEWVKASLFVSVGHTETGTYVILLNGKAYNLVGQTPTEIMEAVDKALEPLSRRFT